MHLKNVDNAIAVVKSALDSKIDWKELERIVADETAAGNPVASLIANLDLAHSRITLRYAPVHSTLCMCHVQPSGPCFGLRSQDDLA